MSQTKAQVRITSLEEMQHLAIYERHAAIMRAEEAKNRGNIKLNQKELGYAEAFNFVLQLTGEDGSDKASGKVVRDLFK